jgi:hypothetical protein
MKSGIRIMISFIKVNPDPDFKKIKAAVIIIRTLSIPGKTKY